LPAPRRRWDGSIDLRGYHGDAKALTKIVHQVGGLYDAYIELEAKKRGLTVERAKSQRLPALIAMELRKIEDACANQLEDARDAARDRQTKRTEANRAALLDGLESLRVAFPAACGVTDGG
jgi:hypothetical protein